MVLCDTLLTSIYGSHYSLTCPQFISWDPHIIFLAFIHGLFVELRSRAYFCQQDKSA